MSEPQTIQSHAVGRTVRDKRLHRVNSPWLVAAISLVTLGCLLRLYLALHSGEHALFSDMKEYVNLGSAIARGELREQSLDRAIGYPCFVAGVRIAGIDSLVGLYLVQSVISLATVAFLGWYASRLFGATVGWTTVALAAPQLTIAQYSGLALTEVLFLPLLIVWLGLILPGPCRFVELLVAGALCGIAIAVKPAAVALFAGSLLWLLIWGKGGLRQALLFFIMTIMSLTTIVLMFEARTNVKISGLSTAGVNLYLGNSPGARVDGGGQYPMPEDLLNWADGFERNKYAVESAAAYIVSDPLRTLSLMAVRFVRVFSLAPGRVEYEALKSMGIPAYCILAAAALEWSFLVMSTGLSVVVCRQVCVPFYSQFVVFGPYLLMLCITFVQTRFRLPIHVMLIPWASAALVALLEDNLDWRIIRTRWAPLAVAAGLLTLGVCFTLVAYG